MASSKLKPLFKYPGGKSSEYQYIKEYFPTFNTYVEPFLGGGAVYWATDADNWIINDFSVELISIYKFAKEKNNLFLSYLNDIATMWNKKEDFVSTVSKSIKNQKITENIVTKMAKSIFAELYYLPCNIEQFEWDLYECISRKIVRLSKLSKNKEITNFNDNANGAIGAGIYSYLRRLYNCTLLTSNLELKTCLYLFLREFAYSSMFRYNSKGLFNVPFGGNSYAKKDFGFRIQQILDPEVQKKFKKTKIMQGDFSKSFIDDPNAFMFLDPPYDTEFSTYNGHSFDSSEQVRLHDELMRLNHTRWLLVIKSTEFINDLYSDSSLQINSFDKTYSVNFQNRNNKDTKHLVITNY